MCVRVAVVCAADACATETTAGIGGWWIPPGQERNVATAQWFAVQLTRADLPEWFRTAESTSLQSCIGALAQLVFLILQTETCEQKPGQCILAAVR